MTPEAIAAWSVEPYLHVGRAAYGALIFGTGAALLHLRRRRTNIGAFFDRVALALGGVFLLVRTGCFLEGCDYGTPTASWIGMRHPSGSLPALDHAARGWVRADAPSLPVHPAQLYEGLVAMIASGVAWIVLRRRGPAGASFLAWLAVYAVGRAIVESVRGDVERGAYLALSTAQWTSIAIVIVALVLLARAYRTPALARDGS